MNEFRDDRRGAYSTFGAVTTTEDQSWRMVSVDTNTERNEPDGVPRSVPSPLFPWLQLDFSKTGCEAQYSEEASGWFRGITGGHFHGTCRSLRSSGSTDPPTVTLTTCTNTTAAPSPCTQHHTATPTALSYTPLTSINSAMSEDIARCKQEKEER